MSRFDSYQAKSSQVEIRGGALAISRNWTLTPTNLTLSQQLAIDQFAYLTRGQLVKLLFNIVTRYRATVPLMNSTWPWANGTTTLTTVCMGNGEDQLLIISSDGAVSASMSLRYVLHIAEGYEQKVPLYRKLLERLRVCFLLPMANMSVDSQQTSSLEAENCNKENNFNKADMLRFVNETRYLLLLTSSVPVGMTKLHRAQHGTDSDKVFVSENSRSSDNKNFWEPSIEQRFQCINVSDLETEIEWYWNSLRSLDRHMAVLGMGCCRQPSTDKLTPMWTNVLGPLESAVMQLVQQPQCFKISSNSSRVSYTLHFVGLNQTVLSTKITENTSQICAYLNPGYYDAVLKDATGITRSVTPFNDDGSNAEKPIIIRVYNETDIVQKLTDLSCGKVQTSKIANEIVQQFIIDESLARQRFMPTTVLLVDRSRAADVDQALSVLRLVCLETDNSSYRQRPPLRHRTRLELLLLAPNVSQTGLVAALYKRGTAVTLIFDSTVAVPVSIDLGQDSGHPLSTVYHDIIKLANLNSSGCPPIRASTNQQPSVAAMWLSWTTKPLKPKVYHANLVFLIGSISIPNCCPTSLSSGSLTINCAAARDQSTLTLLHKIYILDRTEPYAAYRGRLLNLTRPMSGAVFCAVNCSLLLRTGRLGHFWLLLPRRRNLLELSLLFPTPSSNDSEQQQHQLYHFSVQPHTSNLLVLSHPYSDSNKWLVSDSQDLGGTFPQASFITPEAAIITLAVVGLLIMTITAGLLVLYWRHSLKQRAKYRLLTQPTPVASSLGDLVLGSDSDDLVLSMPRSPKRGAVCYKPRPLPASGRSH